MFGRRQARHISRCFRAGLVWAAIPLVVFNGRTVVGCGCTGHFESVCHCRCCSETEDGGKQHGQPACACCAGHGFARSSCPCCVPNKLAQRHNAAECDSRSTDGQALDAHHCKSIAVHEVIPVTVAPAVDASNLYETVFAPAAFSLPLSSGPSHVGQLVDFDTGPPPNDLVVTLHRLVI